METHKQTWWDKEIKNQFSEFKSWVGSPAEPSKIWARNYIDSRGAKSIVDIGCGMCDEYFIYRDTLPNISWVGIEPSKFLWNLASDNDIPVVNKEGHATHLFNEGVDVAYSRHVLEHQESFEPILTEMIRVASKCAIHIFFIPPRDKEIINYNPENNLYHNTYDRNKMNKWLVEHRDVSSFEWIPITKTEEALVVNLKDDNFRKDWYNKSAIE